MNEVDRGELPFFSIDGRSPSLVISETERKRLRLMA